MLWSLVSSPFGGTVYPVSVKHASVLGIKAYARVGEIPEAVDLAVLVTPAQTVPNIVSECIEARVRGAVVISAGFKEYGEHGRKLESEILERVRGSGLRLIGPNCLGVMNPATGLNATFARPVCRAPEASLSSVRAVRFAQRSWIGLNKNWWDSVRSYQ